MAAWGVNRIENVTITLASGGTFDGTSFVGNFGVSGSTGNDVIRTGAGNNLITPRAGRADISAGAGDDIISFQPAPAGYQDAAVTRANFLAADELTRSYTLHGAIDGGAGTDILEFNFVSYWQHAWGGYAYDAPGGFYIDLSKALITDIETLRVSGAIFQNNTPNDLS